MRIFIVLTCCVWHNSAFLPGCIPKSHVSGRHLKKKITPLVLKQQEYNDSMPPSQNDEDSYEYGDMPPSQSGEESYMPPSSSIGGPSYVQPPPYANGDPSFIPPPPPPYPNGDPDYMPAPPFGRSDPAAYTPSQPSGESQMMPPLPDDDFFVQDDIQNQFQGLGGSSSNQSAKRFDSTPLKRDVSQVPRAGDRPYGSAFSFRGDAEGTFPSSQPRYPLGYQKGERRATGTNDGGLTQRGFPMQETFSFRPQQDSSSGSSSRSLRQPPTSFDRPMNDDEGGYYKQDVSKIPRAGDRPYGSAYTFRGDNSSGENFPRGQPMFQGNNRLSDSSRLKYDVSQFRGPNIPRVDRTPSTFREYASPFSFRDASDNTYSYPMQSKRAAGNSKGLQHDNSKVPRVSDGPYGSGFSMRGDQGVAPPSRYQPDRPGQKFMTNDDDSRGLLKQDNNSQVPRASDRPYGSGFSVRGDQGVIAPSSYQPDRRGQKSMIDSSGLKHDVSKLGNRDDNPYEESYSFGQDRNMKW